MCFARDFLSKRSQSREAVKNDPDVVEVLKI